MHDFQMSFLAGEHRSTLRAEADRARLARGAEHTRGTARATKPTGRRAPHRLHIGRVAIF